jgi:hypothetical protein
MATYNGTGDDPPDYPSYDADEGKSIPVCF